jgi:hypothetical protein
MAGSHDDPCENFLYGFEFKRHRVVFDRPQEEASA